MWPFSPKIPDRSPQAQYRTISVRDVPQRLRAGAKLVDVRSPREFNAVHPRDAINVTPRMIKQDEIGLERDTEIMLICLSGSRSERAARDLVTLGYTNVSNVQGGLNTWVKFNLPVVVHKR
jgi:rhodanese-related sulfurtransferase